MRIDIYIWYRCRAAATKPQASTDGVERGLTDNEGGLVEPDLLWEAVNLPWNVLPLPTEHSGLRVRSVSVAPPAQELIPQLPGRAAAHLLGASRAPQQQSGLRMHVPRLKFEN
eukprot:COSAG02_NODE_550_length_20437_cov_4.270676_17_plen_113_part_00